MFPAVFVQKSILRTIINNVLDLKKNFAGLLSVKLVFENVVDYHYEREMCKKRCLLKSKTSLHGYFSHMHLV